MNRRFLLHCLTALAALVVPVVAPLQVRAGELPSVYEHRTSAWYRELTSERPNVVRLYAALDADSSVAAGCRSAEWKQAVRWLAEHWHLADRDGWLADTLPASYRFDLSSTLGSKELRVLEQQPWRGIGPYSWDRAAVAATGSMGIGVIRSLAQHPRHTEVVFAGTISAGLWKSTTSGREWTNVTDPLPVTTVWDIAIAPSQPQYVYAATNVGVIRSINRGDRFSLCDPANGQRHPTAKSASHVAVDPSDPLHVVAVYDRQVQYSTDGGQTWTSSLAPAGEYWDLRWHPTDASILYALHRSNGWVTYLRSADGGASFVALPDCGLPVVEEAGQDGARLLRGCLATSAADPRRVWVIYAGTRHDTLGGVWGLYTSYDAGQTFEHVCCGEEGVEVPDAVERPNLFDYRITGTGVGQVTWDMAFAVSDRDTSLMVVGGIFPYVSVDGGRRWGSMASIHYDIQDALITDDAIWVSHDGGVHYSQDSGRTMIDRSDGINALQVWGFGMSHRANVMALGAYHMPIIIRDDALYDVGRFEGGWYGWSGADAMMADVNPDDDRWIYAKPWNSVRAERSRTVDSPPRSQDLGIDLGYLPFSNIAFHPSETYTIVAADHRSKSIVRTHTNAGSWDTLRTFSSTITHVRICSDDPTVLLAVADGELWRSTDDGQSWTVISPARALTGSAAIIDAVFGQTGSELLVGYGGRQSTVKVLRSTDGGATWRDESYGLPPVALRCLAVTGGPSPTVFAGTETGVFVRTSGQAQWSVMGTGLPVTQVSFLRIDDVRGVLIAGTERGLWQTTLPFVEPPRARIARSRSDVRCSRTPVRFYDRSQARNTIGYSRQWLFPGGEPATSTADVVDVTYAMPGTYAATLVVHNDDGSDTTILDEAVVVHPSECDDPDHVPGLAIDLRHPADRVRLGRIDTTLSEATFMAWVYVDGSQPDFSAIFCTDGVDNSQEFGMQFFAPNNEVGYLWSGGRWWWRSGLQLQPNRWHHVALIIRPTGATVMVDGISATDSLALAPVDMSTLDVLLGTYHLWDTRNASLLIDEVRLFSRALHADDVRRMMHHPISPTMPGLLAWYQMNESDQYVLYDRARGGQGILEQGAVHQPSTIPFGLGRTVVNQRLLGNWIPTDTTWCGIEFVDPHDHSIMITRLDRAVEPLTNDLSDDVTGLPAEFWIRDVTGSSLVRTVRVALHPFIDATDAERRTFSYWHSPMLTGDATWTLQPVDGGVPYLKGTHVINGGLEPAVPLPLRIRAAMTGGPTSASESVTTTIQLLPQPATNVLRIVWPEHPIQDIQIFDMHGWPLATTPWNPTPDGAMLDVRTLPTGVYVMRLDGRTQRFSVVR